METTRATRRFGLCERLRLVCAFGLLGCGETEHGYPALMSPPATSGAGGAGGAAAGGASQAGQAALAGAFSTTGGAGGVSPAVETTSPITGTPGDVVRAKGCGTPFPGESRAKVTIQTRGIKDPDCAAHLPDGTPVCGPWTASRDYYVFLPIDYDPTRAYPLIIEAPGCGGKGSDVYPLRSLAASAIRVGLSPGPNELGHGTNPGQGCFDSKEGDDSIDWPFYDAVYDRLEAELCFDRNRVFVVGNFDGAAFANELACKYAGDSQRSVRGVVAYAGGLPTDPRYAPQCSDKPLAGLWAQEIDSQIIPFAGALVAVNRAMPLAKCPSGQTYDTASFGNYPIGGNNADDVCRRLAGCDPLYPLVVCPLPGMARTNRENVVDPGTAALVESTQPPAP